MNLDDRVWTCAGHPDVVAIARHFLGPRCRVVEACCKPTWPGAPAQSVHTDSVGEFARVPDVPWMINTIWMLTDFTVDNGATGVVPMSHRSRCKRPPGKTSKTRHRVRRFGHSLAWRSVSCRPGKYQSKYSSRIEHSILSPLVQQLD